MPPARAHLEDTLYIRLAEIEPPIWRRIVVPANLTLHQLHQVLQVTMGWTHSHLHQFIVPGTQESIYYGKTSPEDDYFHKDDRRVPPGRHRAEREAPPLSTSTISATPGGVRSPLSVSHPPRKRNCRIPGALMGSGPALLKTWAVSAAMPDFLEAWRDRSHPEHREPGSGLGSISSRNCFRCRKSTPGWLSSSPFIASHKTVQANVPAHLAYRSRPPH